MFEIVIHLVFTATLEWCLERTVITVKETVVKEYKKRHEEPKPRYYSVSYKSWLK